MKLKFTQTQDIVTGKVTYFFSVDHKWPVNEAICSVDTLKQELTARQININDVHFGLFMLGNNQYGCYAESKLPIVY